MTNPDDLSFASSGTLDAAGNFHYGSSGLTKREYFATMAMQGLIAGRMHVYISSTFEDENTHKKLAEWAAMDADALIEALNEEAK